MAKKKKAESFGHLEAALMDKMPTPKLTVRAHISDDFGINEGHYRKSEVKRLQQEIDHIEKELKDWNGEAIASKALKSLKSELAMKRARKMEAEAYLEQDDVEEEVKPAETKLEK